MHHVCEICVSVGIKYAEEMDEGFTVQIVLAVDIWRAENMEKIDGCKQFSHQQCNKMQSKEVVHRSCTT